MDKIAYPIGRFMFEGMTKAQQQDWTLQLEQYPALIRALIEQLNDEQLDTPYRNNGWSIRQVVHHIADSTSNAFTRFKLALTEKNPTIKPFKEDKWAITADSLYMPVEPSLAIIDGTYTRLVALLKSMDMSDFEKQFYHPERGSQVTLKQFLCYTKWHSYHHLAHIKGVFDRHSW